MWELGLGDRPSRSLVQALLQMEPRGEQHRVINKHRHCSPCTRFGSTPQCPYAVECMKQIFVNEVFEAVNDLLAQEDTKV